MLCRIVRDTGSTCTSRDPTSAQQAIGDTESVLRVKQVQLYLKQPLGT